MTPVTWAVCRRATKSSQPTRRGRPVEVPYSLPTSLIRSAASPGISVGNGPSPTRLMYSLATPITSPKEPAVSPVPVSAPPDEQTLDVQ